MSDLVRECREACCEDYTLNPCPVGKRAANEIERLRGLVKDARELVDQAYSHIGGNWPAADEFLERATDQQVDGRD